MKNTKVIANYLPQFHVIPENNSWWGEGYTDWVAVKKATALFENHNQPRIPEGKNYYDLTDVEVLKWQAKVAREHGVDAFGMYHYWFSSDMKLLEKPAELLLENRNIDIGFMFIWDNASWKRTWSNVKVGNDWAPEFEREGVGHGNNGMLAELKYGSEKDWEKHFNYMLPFFKDARYVKIEGKPVFVFFNQDNEPETLKKMCAYWDQMATLVGFPGMVFVGKQNNQNISYMEYEFVYEPERHGWIAENVFHKIINRCRRYYYQMINKPILYDYDKIWENIIRNAEKCNDERILYGGFVDYDDSPRRGMKGKVVLGFTPDKFKKYLSQILEISRKQDKELLFLTAWNEWGEGAYLEPDEMCGDSALKALKDAVIEQK